ncbi:hypothetical protein F4859DRAFT_487211 [Xylaria cf. heliscus]|nr:hypothetical protein F4859DRAFT_487211 [Xylaria cf. heliscus]
MQRYCIIRTLGFKIGEVTKINRRRLSSEATDAARIKQLWDVVMTELDLPVCAR